MRAFLGIPFEPPAFVLEILEAVRETKADVKPVDPRNLHVTLRFLGDIPEAQAGPILEALRREAMPKDYEVVLKSVGAFPDWKKLNVLWVGLQDPEGHVARSYAIAQRVFAGLGFPDEDRGFRPHVTIARKRGEPGKEQL